MRYAAKGTRLFGVLILIATFGVATSGRLAAAPGAPTNLDPVLRQRASQLTGESRVIVRLSADAPRGAAQAILERLGGRLGRALSLINSHAGSIPNAALAALAASPFVEHVSSDRLIVSTMERTSAAIGSATIRQLLGLDGSGVGVAIIDSGITGWHDDLTDAPAAAQRVDRFVDLVAQRDAAYDDYGHGTHVAGIVAGNGFDSSGARAGIAPGARLTVLKVLDGSGRGRVSDVIAALDYIVANKSTLNIRVANLSVMAPAFEPYDVDPLTLAAKRAVQAGIVVVAAAGNLGRTADGALMYGGIGAPANAPWVLTVGASSHQGTIDRADDSIAAFSSRGPGLGGYTAKPDIVAPGVGIESLADPHSAIYTLRAPFLLRGTVATAYEPYVSLSGTSMSAPVVSGTVALMLQANPKLTPNQVKAILQYTAQVYPGHDTLTQGAGFLNAQGAIRLASYFANPFSTRFPTDTRWGRRLIWGNRLVVGGKLTANANAWPTTVTWGSATTSAGANIEWGVIEVAGTDGVTERRWNLAAGSENVVWGTTCGGADCQAPWSPSAAFGIMAADDTVVWGMEFDTVVWGMDGDDTVVWGMDGDDTVVWGMNCVHASCEPVIWSNR
jgi:serine protease AprX